jgi:hypothetical protein
MSASVKAVVHIVQPCCLPLWLCEWLQDVKAGLEPHFVDSYQQIYQLAFQEPPSPSSNQQQEAAAAAA